MPRQPELSSARWGLSAPELLTTAVAVVVSVTLYVSLGSPYLARGVVGDLLGFVVLAVVGIRLGERLRHEALLCLVMIGVVLLLSPDWPLRMPDPLWWAAFGVGLGYLLVRRRLVR